MGFGGKVDDGVDVFFGKNLSDECGVADIAFHKAVSGILFNIRQVAGIAGVGQFIEIDDAQIGVVLQGVADKISADKSAAAGNE
jgi:hypothetical protein